MGNPWANVGSFMGINSLQRMVFLNPFIVAWRRHSESFSVRSLKWTSV